MEKTKQLRKPKQFVGVQSDIQHTAKQTNVWAAKQNYTKKIFSNKIRILPTSLELI